MKRNFALVLVLSMLLTISACSGPVNDLTTDPTSVLTTELPATEPPATEPPATEPPATEPPSTEPPATEPPATEPPSTEPPATEPPVTESPATEPPSTEPSDMCTEITNTVPVGGLYIIEHNGKYIFEGETMPSTPSIGDVFYYGDYRYSYVCIENHYGWDVCAVSLTDRQQYKSSYGEILLSINNFPIIAMTSTFYSNMNLKTVPSIPNTVIDMTQTFLACTALESAPILPEGLLTMAATFADCSALRTYEGAEAGTAYGDFSNYDVPVNVSDIDILGAFDSCPQITSLPRGISVSFAEEMLPYAGVWYLEGYSDVYILMNDIYEDNWTVSLSLEAINFALPKESCVDSLVPPYTAYPYDTFVDNPTENCWNSYIQILCHRSEWKAEITKHNLEFADNCVYLGGKKFIREQGNTTMYDDTCYLEALGDWYMESNPDSIISIWPRQDLGSLGDYFEISMWNFDIYTLESSGCCSVCGYAARRSTWEYYGVSANNGVLTIENKNGKRIFYKNAVTIDNGNVVLSLGETEKLYSTVLPQQTTDQSVTWSSSNQDVAIVNGNIVTAVGEGTAILTVTSKVGGHTASCTITVNALPTDIPVTEPPTTKPPATEPPTTEPPTTEPPATEPPATELVSNVLIISDTRTISNQTIDTDVYITSAGVVTFNNVTVNGNIYCYGQLNCSACTADDVYAYAYGSMLSCGAFDGTHGKISGGLSCSNMVIQDTALDYAFAMWGKY